MELRDQRELAAVAAYSLSGDKDAWNPALYSEACAHLNGSSKPERMTKISTLLRSNSFPAVPVDGGGYIERCSRIIANVLDAYADDLTKTIKPPKPLPKTLILVLDGPDDVSRHWECSACGNDQFQYNESHPSSRTMNENDESGLTFDGDFEWYDGDSDPGVVCASCESVLVVPESCEIDFS